MTDTHNGHPFTLDTMLNAARALHDRNPNDPGDCITCCNSAGTPLAWPCPTATALGATGRSEWLTPATTPDDQCRIWGPDGGTWPTNEEENYRCIRNTDHTGNHTDGNGHQW